MLVVPLGTYMPDETYPVGMAERLARVEAKMDALDDKMDLFIRTAGSPDVGFASAGLLNELRSQADREHLAMRNRIEEVLNRLNRRVDGINDEHNERLKHLEADLNGRYQSLSNRVWAMLFGLVAVLGGLSTDIFIHATGKLP